MVKTSDELEKHRHVLKALEKEASFEEIEGDIKKVEETKEVKFTDAQLEQAFVELLGQEGIHHHLGIIIGRIKECGSRPSQKTKLLGINMLTITKILSNLRYVRYKKRG